MKQKKFKPQKKFKHAKITYAITILLTLLNVIGIYSYAIQPNALMEVIHSQKTNNPTPEICALSNNITANATNDLNKALALTLWVSENIPYDYQRADDIFSQTPEQTITLKKGVCRDTAVLLTTLMKCQGLNAELKTAKMAFNNNWQAHAFVRLKINNETLYCDNGQCNTKETLWVG